MPTPWRKLSYEQISNLELSGKVLDLGGSRKSNYHQLIKGDFVIEVVNIDKDSGLDKNFDLEDHFPLPDDCYNAVLAINVLEHIFDYKNFLSESFRVLKKEGTLVIAVPFLMFVHPSPRDHWRYTKGTIEKLLQEEGFKDIKVTSVGEGPFMVLGQMLGGVRMPDFLRAILYYKLLLLDKFISLFIKPEVLRERYPLGYYVVAKKKS